MASNFSPFGTDLFGEPIKQYGRGQLADRFIFPPFSVLDARNGDWQNRKRAWISLGIKSELGRVATSFTDQSQSKENQRQLLATSSGTGFYADKRKKEIELGRELTTAEFQEKYFDESKSYDQGTSIFDPVLCELAYRWWCPPGGQVVDPFAGGSVRGLIAVLTEHKYWGCDLNRGQIEANEEQAEEICNGESPYWVCGDALEVLDRAPAADFVFTCPPYGDLERYSDDPRDLSTMEYHTFLANYKRIILRCSKVLKSGCYACFVIGDFRDRRTGFYRGFVADTIIAFRDVGMHLYNDGILMTAVGSLPVRVSNQFEKSRKLGKTHQNVLVFKKD